MNETEFQIYKMIKKLSEHQKERGQLQESFLSNFIASEIEKGSHRDGIKTRDKK